MGVFADIPARAHLLWHSGGRAAVALRAGGAAALVCAAFVSVAASARSEPASPLPVAASGAFPHWNSREQTHILTAPDMNPGDEVEGHVEIKNMGDVKGSFTLLKRPVDDPSLRSVWLQVRVHDVTPPGPPVPIYQGSLAAMPAATPIAELFDPAEKRRYRFIVRFEPPSPPAGGHPTATTSVEFAWGADPVTPAAPPAPAPPTPPPAPAQAPAPAPAPAPAAPAPARAPAKAPARAPSKAKTCLKKLSAKKMTAAAKKRAVAACKKKLAKKKPVKRKKR